MELRKDRRILGYARVSTRSQDLTYQLDRLAAAGCTQIFHEKRSGKSRDQRPQLAEMLGIVGPGDLVLATVTDRIARDPLDLLNIVHAVKAAGAELRLLDEPFIDTTTELCDLVLYIIGWAARWQRLRILENTAHGRQDAMRRGVKFGRPRKLSLSQFEEIQKQRLAGETIAAIATMMNVSESTISRMPRALGDWNATRSPSSNLHGRTSELADRIEDLRG